MVLHIQKNFTFLTLEIYVHLDEKEGVLLMAKFKSFAINLVIISHSDAGYI